MDAKDDDEGQLRFVKGRNPREGADVSRNAAKELLQLGKEAKFVIKKQYVIEDRMKIQKACSMALKIVGALMMTSVWTANASTAPSQLNCVLTNTGTQAGSANQTIVVTFDADAKTLTAQEGSQSYNFSKVSISNVSISGAINSVSLGIDRSSLGFVWQQYGADKAVTEFGQCQPTNHPAAADTH
jgi:hypothetical protein